VVERQAMSDLNATVVPATANRSKPSSCITSTWSWVIVRFEILLVIRTASGLVTVAIATQVGE
jgi:hypothetical protein